MQYDPNFLGRISNHSNESSKVGNIIVNNKYRIGKVNNDYSVTNTVAPPRKSILLSKKKEVNNDENSALNLFKQIKENKTKITKKGVDKRLNTSNSFKKKNNFEFVFEKLEKSTQKMISFFLERNPFQNIVRSFIETYPNTDTIVDLFRVIEKFPEFNFFEYMKIPMTKPTESEEAKLRKFYINRNNFFHCVMIEMWKYNKDISPLQKHIETFIKLNNENIVKIEIDADFFFLLLFGLKDKAVSFLIKNNNYFKNFFKDYKELDPLKDFKELRLDMNFFELNLEEIWIIRKIIRNIIVREHFEGLEFLLMYKDDIHNFLIEGAIWKDIVCYFESEEIEYLWNLYQTKLNNSDDKVYIKTIHLSNDPEYANGLKVLIEQIKKDKTLGKPTKEEDIKKIDICQEELLLGPVNRFTDILEICFKYSKKETAYYLIKKSIEIPGVINQEVFEICLNYNEDISM